MSHTNNALHNGAGRASCFIDRDGTIIEDYGYIREARDIVFIPGAIEALRDLQLKGYLLFLVSNQSAVGRKIISQKKFNYIHSAFIERVHSEGVFFSDCLYCFHHPDIDCHCRKPKPGLIPQEYNNQKIDIKRSFVFGDRLCDIQLGNRIGAQKSFLLLTGHGKKTYQEEKDLNHLSFQIAPSLIEATQYIPSIPPPP